MQIMMVYQVYDDAFQNGFSPYDRMGAVLEDTDKETFLETRKQQIITFKRFATILNLMMLIPFFSVISLLILDVDFTSSPAGIVIGISKVIIVIISIILVLSLISIELKSSSLRSMIAVVESKGFVKDLVINQYSSLTRWDLLRNKDYQILVSSYFKKYRPPIYRTYHDIPFVNYSIFKKEKNGTFDENKIPNLLENDITATNYLRKTILPDLKFTSLWKPKKKLEILMYISLVLEILALNFLFAVDQSNLYLFIFALLLVFVPLTLFWVPYRYQFTLSPKRVEEILTENNIDYTSENKFDKIIELVDSEFPYIDL